MDADVSEAVTTDDVLEDLTSKRYTKQKYLPTNITVHNPEPFRF